MRDREREGGLRCRGASGRRSGPSTLSAPASVHAGDSLPQLRVCTGLGPVSLSAVMVVRALLVPSEGCLALRSDASAATLPSLSFPAAFELSLRPNGNPSETARPGQTRQDSQAKAAAAARCLPPDSGTMEMRTRRLRSGHSPRNPRPRPHTVGSKPALPAGLQSTSATGPR